LDAQASQATPPSRRIAFNTVIFSIATGLSRIAGLIREVVASSYFGTSGPFSAFTIAFQVPNLIRALEVIADLELETRGGGTSQGALGEDTLAVRAVVAATS